MQDSGPWVPDSDTTAFHAAAIRSMIRLGKLEHFLWLFILDTGWGEGGGDVFVSQGERSIQYFTLNGSYRIKQGSAREHKPLSYCTYKPSFSKKILTWNRRIWFWPIHFLASLVIAYKSLGLLKFFLDSCSVWKVRISNQELMSLYLVTCDCRVLLGIFLGGGFPG